MSEPTTGDSGSERASTTGGGTQDLTAAGGHGAVPTSGVPSGIPAGAPSGAPPTGKGADASRPSSSRDWPLFEVFVRGKRGLNHIHVGSLHAPDATMALRNARDVYTRRQEGVSLWVVPAAAITATSPSERDSFFDPAADKVYRHPTFYDVPADVEYL